MKDHPVPNVKHRTAPDGKTLLDDCKVVMYLLERGGVAVAFR